jgi:pimeloyl-ACP methyl ester carboxylesterase
MTKPPLSYADIGGLRAAHIVVGDGKPLLMLHGWGANIGLLWPLAEQLVRLGYRIYIPDLPGFGETPSSSQAWSVHDYTNFVSRFLDYHHLDKVYLFGHSFGGRLGLVMGAECPERLIKMALADSAGIRSKSSTTAQLRLKIYRSALNSLNAVGLSNQASQLREWYNNRYASADYKAASGVMRETFVKVIHEDLLPYAARINVPTLLFWGDEDSDTPLWQGQLLEKTIPDAGLVVLAGAGHYSYLDKLAETVRVMDYFFKQE